ncbi:response regulator transcription factor [Halomonas saccharevitans]|uniref:Response regulator transcription factor n=1 Tax=Halomonas saccharevitans TaxID=416872 RepID=A0A1I6XPG5_9GAMM|nr:response regulator transcription factor [Halomonas saccharevitans]MDT8879621.1 response regulator transcription factor [Halomonas saccharevitans]SFT40339.1 two component transcriptional regulator, LuxR family [Halomonas saccharevitans]
MHTLMVADDHPLFREAIGAVIAAGLPDSRLLEAESLAHALQRAGEHADLDLVLLDLGLPDASGLEGLRALREAYPALPVAILSADQERRTVLEAIDLGAVGYIPKSTPRHELQAALTRLLEGQLYLPADVMRCAPAAPARPPADEEGPRNAQRLAELTDKQLEVLIRLSRGASNKVIARELDIAETTVKTHVSAILRKLHVSGRVQAILAAGALDLEALLAERHAPSH